MAMLQHLVTLGGHQHGWLRDREHVLEEEYFWRKERALLARLREERRRQREIRALGARLHVGDEVLLAELQRAGFTSENVDLLHLVPLVEGRVVRRGRLARRAPADPRAGRYVRNRGRQPVLRAAYRLAELPPGFALLRHLARCGVRHSPRRGPGTADGRRAHAGRRLHDDRRGNGRDAGSGARQRCGAEVPRSHRAATRAPREGAVASHCQVGVCAAERRGVRGRAPRSGPLLAARLRSGPAIATRTRECLSSPVATGLATCTRQPAIRIRSGRPPIDPEGDGPSGSRRPSWPMSTAMHDREERPEMTLDDFRRPAAALLSLPLLGATVWLAAGDTAVEAHGSEARYVEVAPWQRDRVPRVLAVSRSELGTPGTRRTMEVRDVEGALVPRRRALRPRRRQRLRLRHRRAGHADVDLRHRADDAVRRRVGPQRRRRGRRHGRDRPGAGRAPSQASR